jgi:predicted  nucleic acid-binding Zn-ribbon protein
VYNEARSYTDLYVRETDTMEVEMDRRPLEIIRKLDPEFFDEYDYWYRKGSVGGCKDEGCATCAFL